MGEPGRMLGWREGIVQGVQLSAPSQKLDLVQWRGHICWFCPLVIQAPHYYVWRPCVPQDTLGVLSQASLVADR